MYFGCHTKRKNILLALAPGICYTIQPLTISPFPSFKKFVVLHFHSIISANTSQYTQQMILNRKRRRRFTISHCESASPFYGIFCPKLSIICITLRVSTSAHSAPSPLPQMPQRAPLLSPGMLCSDGCNASRCLRTPDRFRRPAWRSV